MDVQNQTNWKLVITTVLVVLVIYVLWDLYVQEDPLTRTAEIVDDSLDTAVGYAGHTVGYIYDGTGQAIRVIYDGTKSLAGATVDVAGNVIDSTGQVIGVAVDVTGDVLGAAYDTTGKFVGGVVHTTGRVIGGAADITGRVAGGVYDATGNVVRGVGNVTGGALVYAGSALRSDYDYDGEEMGPIDMEQEIPGEELAEAPLEMTEGNMIKDLNGVRASEEVVDSEVMAVTEDLDEAVVEADAIMAAKKGNAGVTQDENGDNVEGFYYYDYPRYCTHCGEKGRYSCNNCVNCGYCITPDGTGECVSGDANGPHFREDCIAYEHNANGYRVYRRYPYRYLSGLPYFRRDGYYHDLRGYPNTKYVRRVGSHIGRKRIGRSNVRYNRAAARAARTGRDVVRRSGPRVRAMSHRRTSSLPSGKARRATSLKYSAGRRGRTMRRGRR